VEVEYDASERSIRIRGFHLAIEKNRKDGHPALWCVSKHWGFAVTLGLSSLFLIAGCRRICRTAKIRSQRGSEVFADHRGASAGGEHRGRGSCMKTAISIRRGSGADGYREEKNEMPFR